MKIFSKMIPFTLVKDGQDGKPGESAYVHFAYADSTDGLNFSLTDTNRYYTGVYSGFNKTPPTDHKLYQWKLTKSQVNANFAINSDGRNLRGYVKNYINLDEQELNIDYNQKPFKRVILTFYCQTYNQPFNARFSIYSMTDKMYIYGNDLTIENSNEKYVVVFDLSNYNIKEFGDSITIETINLPLDAILNKIKVEVSDSPTPWVPSAVDSKGSNFRGSATESEVYDMVNDGMALPGDVFFDGEKFIYVGFDSDIYFSDAMNFPDSPMPINAGPWSPSITYRKSKEVVPYVWVWNEKSNTRQFFILNAESSIGDDPLEDNQQGSGSIWRYNEYASLLLARKIQADEIDVDNLIAKKLQTVRSGPRIEIAGTTLDIYGNGKFPNIRFGIDDKGYAVLTYYTNDGKKLYDLGPSGISKLQFIAPYYTPVYLYKLDNYVAKYNIKFGHVMQIKNEQLTQKDAVKYYSYNAGTNPIIGDEEKDRENYIYKQEYDGERIDDGIYFSPPVIEGAIPQYAGTPGETGDWIKPGPEGTLYEDNLGVLDRRPIYSQKIVAYKGGKLIYSKIALWNGREPEDWRP